MSKQTTQGQRRRRARNSKAKHSGGTAVAEQLEDRLMMSAGDPVSLVGGVLSVHGTDAADTILVEDAAFGSTVVRINDTPHIHPTCEIDRIQVFGYQGDDKINLDTALPAVVYGHEGDDVIRACWINGNELGRPRRVLYGGPGDDVLFGGYGDDVIYGGAGSDTILEHSGSNILYGDYEPTREVWSLGAAGWRKVTDSLDSLAPVPERRHQDGPRGLQMVVVSVYDRILTKTTTEAGPLGVDVIAELQSKCVGILDALLPHGLKSGPSADQDPADQRTFLDGGIVPSWLFSGDDIISGGDGEDYIYGGGGDDELYGWYGSDHIYGEDGNDEIHGGSNYGYWFDGASEDDTAGDHLYGGPGNDSIGGGKGDDYAWGGQGNDSISGGPGNDHLYGDSGNDTIHGGDGDDVIDGYVGDDSLEGGRGEDVIHGDWGDDKIWGDNMHVGSPTGALGENDRIYGGWGDDTIWGGMGADYIEGGMGNDEIHGGGHDDEIHGGSGDDEIHGDTGEDVLYGGSGADTLWGGQHRDYLYGGSGHDTLWGESGDDCLIGGTGNDNLYGGIGLDGLFAHEGEDFVPDLKYYWLDTESDRVYLDNTNIFDAEFVANGVNAGFGISGRGGGHLDKNFCPERGEGYLGSGYWTLSEMAALDDVLLAMQEHRGSVASIQRADGGAVHWYRGGSWTGPEHAWNHGGSITLTDSAFTSARMFGTTVVRQLAHNWDDENPTWTNFKSLSGWTALNTPMAWAMAKPKIDAGWQITTKYGQTWLYNPAATFYADGADHPWDDYGTSWVAYFYGSTTDETMDPCNTWAQTNMGLKCIFSQQILG